MDINLFNNEQITQLEPISEMQIEEVDEGVQEDLEIIEEEQVQNWQIEIPAINLTAPIAEGTTKEIMDQYVGHFEVSNKFNGNIGLIAHNRGYPVNYFGRLKELNIGDEIIYYFGNNQKTYFVNLITIIDDTDWSYLEKTEENRITLITCVEDMPKYRRCIQGIENL